MEKVWQERENALARAEQSAYCLLEAGKMMLKGGAEVYRVEETMTRMGYSIPHVDECVAYVTGTAILCSVEVKGQTITRIMRIKGSSRNIQVINEVNSLSREAEREHFEPYILMARLQEIRHTPNYGDWIKALWGAIGACGFVVFFHGTWPEIISVFFIGLIVRAGTVFCDHLRVNEFFVNVFLSFLAASLSVFCHHLLPAANTDTMIISSIMLLVPGLAITNALRDLVMGESLSAMVVLMQALLVSCAIATGVLLGLYVTGGSL